jgi:hypothetical protein
MAGFRLAVGIRDAQPELEDGASAPERRGGALAPQADHHPATTIITGTTMITPI